MERIKPTAVSYVDDHYFKEEFKDFQDGSLRKNKLINKTYYTYSVKIQTLYVDWIFNDKDDLGINFLKELVQLRRRDLFETNYVKILT